MNFFKNSMRPDNVDAIRTALREHFSGDASRTPLIIGRPKRKRSFQELLFASLTKK